MLNLFTQCKKGEDKLLPIPLLIGGTASVTANITTEGMGDEAGSLTVDLNGTTTDFTTNETRAITVDLSSNTDYTITITAQPGATYPCYVSSGEVVNASADMTVSATVTCGAIVYFSAQNIYWKRCTQGQVYNPASRDCTGTGAVGDNYGVQTYQFCDTADLTCVGGVSGGNLTGDGNSGVYNTCNNLNDPGYAGLTTWRVAGYLELDLLDSLATPSVDATMFPQQLFDVNYWGRENASVTLAGYDNYGILWNFWANNNGYYSNALATNSTYYVRCVADN